MSRSLAGRPIRHRFEGTFGIQSPVSVSPESSIPQRSKSVRRNIQAPRPVCLRFQLFMVTMLFVGAVLQGVPASQWRRTVRRPRWIDHGVTNKRRPRGDSIG